MGRTVEEVREDGGEIKAGVPGGWFVVTRAMFSHPVVGMQIKSPRAEDASRDAWPPFVAWQWLIREARWQAETVMVSGHRLQLQRGQLSHSQRHLARQFNWGHKAVREFLARLARHGMIDVETQNLRSVNVCGTSKTGTDKGTATTVITVRNYGVYQQTPQQEGTANGTAGAQEGHRRGTKEKKVTREQVKEEKDPTQPALETTSARDALAGLNGSSELMIQDVLAWMGRGERINAATWLADQVHLYGQDITRDSYSKLKTDIATGAIIAQPLRVWAKMAAGMKAERAEAKTQHQTKSERERAAAGWMERRYGKKGTS